MCTIHLAVDRFRFPSISWAMFKRGSERLPRGDGARNENPRDEEAARSRESLEEDLADNILELRLPAKRKYLPIVRSTAGVIAGTMSFDYDDILQIRVAVSEAFGVALRRLERKNEPSKAHRQVVYFVIDPPKLEILIADPGGFPGEVAVREEGESRAVLESLVDKVVFGVEAGGRHFVRLVKCKSLE